MIHSSPSVAGIAAISSTEARRLAMCDQKLVMTCARILEKWVGNLVASWW